MGGSQYRLLEQINNPNDLKKLSVSDLPRLAEELRWFIVRSVAKTGGHLGAPLGVVELTLALHYFLNSPEDKIIWDVGHQSYAHKILTGRRDHFHTLRQHKGISGFPKITESEHDAYGTGHASTSVSAALGFAVARDLKGEQHEVVAVIGDGAMTGGNALEAINQAGYLDTKVIVILNDNRMSISKNVGAISEYTHRIEHTDVYQQVKETMNKLIQQGDGLRDELLKLKSHLKDVGSPGLLFEKLGFNYIGPVDGHDIPAILEALKSAQAFPGPSLIHLRTTKGKGFTLAEQDDSNLHGVSPFDPDAGIEPNSATRPTFTDVFAEALVELAMRDDAIVGVTAAMPEGTGLSAFAKRFPTRFFDVGIAEQHAVVFAAAMARQGLKPVCAIYSTFLQRAYDAIIHDVCLQGLPVVFAVDRAGLVGADGPTHHGCFDLSYLRTVPKLVVMAPKDEVELRLMLSTAVRSGQPVAIRYPRGNCLGACGVEQGELEIGKSEVVQQGSDLTLISIGTAFQEAQKACGVLERLGIKTTLINARFAKPVDENIAEQIRRTGKAIVVEENALAGGFGSAVLEMCQDRRVVADIRLLGIPDRFVDHGSQEQLRRECGLVCEDIVEAAEELTRAGCKKRVLGAVV